VDTERDVPALLADIARIGPFFAVATGATPAGGGWVPLHALATPSGTAEVDPLRARIAAVRVALGTDDRVAASTAFQGLAAQVVAPLFAAAAVHGAVPVPDPTPPDDRLALVLHWRPGGAGPWLWWAAPGGHVRPGSDVALVDVLTELLTPLVAAVRARVSVSPRVLWGDAASAVAAARRLVTAARPGSAEHARSLAERLLTTPPLDATAALRAPEPPDAGWTFRRRSCCLYYRVPGGGVCDDCVLRDHARR
jgi:FhuF 2Fe-2S C-terminal domain